MYSPSPYAYTPHYPLPRPPMLRSPLEYPSMSSPYPSHLYSPPPPPAPVKKRRGRKPSVRFVRKTPRILVPANAPRPEDDATPSPRSSPIKSSFLDHSPHHLPTHPSPILLPPSPPSPVEPKVHPYMREEHFPPNPSSEDPLGVSRWDPSPEELRLPPLHLDPSSSSSTLTTITTNPTHTTTSPTSPISTSATSPSASHPPCLSPTSPIAMTFAQDASSPPPIHTSAKERRLERERCQLEGYNSTSDWRILLIPAQSEVIPSSTMTPSSTLLLSLPLILALGLPQASLAQSTCARSSIMETCLTQQNRNVLACKNDPACLCTRLKVRAACYDNCPQDAAAKAAKEKDMTDSTSACSGRAVSVNSSVNTTLSDRALGSEAALKNNVTASEAPSGGSSAAPAPPSSLLGPMAISAMTLSSLSYVLF
ncbi:MAG: hypothetical protein DHS80DRAFT_32462 [Piptocephalis tieghemiana]|nr:MAG: hypothetical protein DHS80DRAFT_32462 [Piptocephalis tieghemiana]